MSSRNRIDGRSWIVGGFVVGLPWPIGESHGPYTKSATTFPTVNAHQPSKPYQGPGAHATPAVTLQQRHAIGAAVQGYVVNVHKRAPTSALGGGGFLS